MVKIRLMRVGKRKQPTYRVVVADSRSPRDGRIIEAIGHYQPRLEPSGVSIDNDRALYWLTRGAQPSGAVRKLLQITGAWSSFTGEAAPQPIAPTPRKATAAASVKATPAASVDEGAGEVADPPEAEDQEGAAPEAETDETTEEA